MEDFKYEVVLKVTVRAYDASDARDMLEDAFGLGEDCGVTIESAAVREL